MSVGSNTTMKQFARVKRGRLFLEVRLSLTILEVVCIVAGATGNGLDHTCTMLNMLHFQRLLIISRICHILQKTLEVQRIHLQN